MKRQRFSVPIGLSLVLGGLLLPMQSQPAHAQADSDFGAGGFDPGEVAPGAVLEDTEYNESVEVEQGLPEATTLEFYVPTATNIIQQLGNGTYQAAIDLGASIELQRRVAAIFTLDTDSDAYVANAQEIIDALVAGGIPAEQATTLVNALADIFDVLINESAFLPKTDAIALKGQSMLLACAEGCELAQIDDSAEDVELDEEVEEEVDEREIRIRVSEADSLVTAVNTFNEIVSTLEPEQVLNPPTSLLLIRSVLFDLVASTWVDGEPPSPSE